MLDFLPALAAYMLYQVITDATKADQLQNIFAEAFKLWSEKAETNDLDTILTGPAPLYWNPLGGTNRTINTVSIRSR